MCSLSSGHFHWNNKIQCEFTHSGHLEIEANKLENLHPPATHFLSCITLFIIIFLNQYLF